jgi:hypothetical protein
MIQPGDIVTFESDGAACRAEVFRLATEAEFRQAAAIADWDVSRFRNDGPWFWVAPYVNPGGYWLRPTSQLRLVDAEAELDAFLNRLFADGGGA